MVIKDFDGLMAQLAQKLPPKLTSQYIVRASATVDIPPSLDGRDLPENFFGLASSYAFDGKSIGPVDFFLSARRRYPEFLISVNESAESPFLSVLRDNRLIQVAVIESDLICVGSVGSMIGEGAVCCIDVSTAASYRGIRLCESFADFLLVTASLFLNRLGGRRELNERIYSKYSLSEKAVAFFEARVA